MDGALSGLDWVCIGWMDISFWGEVLSTYGAKYYFGIRILGIEDG